jgi:hypothetical protein
MLALTRRLEPRRSASLGIGFCVHVGTLRGELRLPGSLAGDLLDAAGYPGGVVPGAVLASPFVLVGVDGHGYGVTPMDAGWIRIDVASLELAHK